MDQPRSLRERHAAVIPHWVDQMYAEPLELVSGQGAVVTDSEGREYLDFFAGLATTAMGHNLPELVDAVKDQLGRIIHSSTLYLIRPMVELAELLVEITPPRQEKAFFVNSGTEAVDAALLVATNFRRSHQVIAFRQSYHGRSFSAVAVTGNRGYSASAFSPLNVQYAPYGSCYRCPFHLTYPSCGVACARDLETVIETQTAGDVAAVIVEPIQGVNGFVTPPPEFLPIVREICDRYGILLISDEIQTGFGRTGEALWGIEADGVEADLMVMAKGMGNGIPIAAVVGRADVMDSLTAGSISTFGGNHLASTAGLANVRYLLDHDVLANVAKQGATVRTALEALQQRFPDAVGEVRGKGLMQAMELADADRTPRPDLAAAVQEACRERGLLVGKGGIAWNAVRLAPPLVVDDAEVGEAVRILGEACASVFA
jgi:4-aminobutyrate aminotransferase